MKLYKLSWLIAIGLCLSLSACAPKAGTQVTSPFSAAVKATDDIATAIKILVAAETDTEKQKLITPQEGLKLIDALSAVQKANVDYQADLDKAIKSGDKNALPVSSKALQAAIINLNSAGVLGIKSDKAKQIFSLTISTITVAMATITAFSSSK